MEREEIINIISENYNLRVKSIEKIKNVYKVEAEEGWYCTKVIKYPFPHFYFILSAILHLQRRGFSTIPDIIKTIKGEYYIKIKEKFAYITEWIPGRVSNFDNPIELSMAARKLKELHKCSENFTINENMKPRIGWFSWIQVFDTRKNEILDFQHRISQKAYKSEFDKLYLKVMPEEIDRAERSIKALASSNYRDLMYREILKRGFCHHDYANHNILIDRDNRINLIDFDYCILDTHLHDLSSLLIRAMKNGKWNGNKAEKILLDYSMGEEIGRDERILMREFIRFPQGFWQLGIQMYWEQQPWEDKEFMGRLKRYIEDRDEREEFVNNFFK